MPRENAALQYARLNDFSPGIQANPIIGSSPTIPGPLGIAHPIGTYRCLPLPSGGLGPAPGRSASVNGPVQSSSYDEFITGLVIGPPTGPDLNIYTIPGFTSPQRPIWPSTVTFDDPALAAAVPTLVWIGRSRIQTTGGNAFHQGITTFGVAGTGAYANQRLSSSDPIAAANVPTRVMPVNMTAGRSAGASYNLNGDTANYIIAANWFPPQPLTSLAAGYFDYYPDPTSQSALLDMSTSTRFSTHRGPLLYHQGRIMCMSRYGFWTGDNVTPAAYYFGNNVLVWTNLYATPRSNPSGGTVYGDRQIGWGAWGSLTASDMVLIGYNDGGILVQGSLNAPTVRSLTNITPTYGAETVGAATPIGFVYGSHNHGVHVWGGGAESTHLSPNLPGDFWIPPPYRDGVPKGPTGDVNAPPTYYLNGHRGQFAQWGPDYIMCPNGYFFNIPTKSWWRIDDPANGVLANFAAAPYAPHLYATYATMQAGNNTATPLYAMFSAYKPATSYKWSSQLFYPAQDPTHRTDVETIGVLAMGAGTITVTLTTEAGATVTKALNFTADSTYQWFNCDLSGYAYTLSLLADSGNANPAPSIHEVLIGYQGGRGAREHS